MAKELNISINKACLENWDSFEKEGTKGFCEKCQKNVIDFTGFSDREIIDFFNKKSSGVCGRFRPEQLKKYRLQNERIKLPKIALIAAGVLTLAQSKEGFGQEIKKEIFVESKTTLHHFGQKEKPASKVDTLTHILKGHVYSIEEESNLPGAIINIKGTQIAGKTDVDGKFQLTYTGEKENIILVISYIGFATIEKEIALQQPTIDIGKVNMTIDATELMGEVCIIYRKWSPRWIWHQIVRIF